MIGRDDLRVVTQARANRGRNWPICYSRGRSPKHVKSNAIVYVKDLATVGVGAGQMSRVRVRLASPRANRRDMAEVLGLGAPLTQGSVVASRRVLSLRRWAAGLPQRPAATALIQPGGSVRDDEVIAAADAAVWPWSLPASAIFAH